MRNIVIFPFRPLIFDFRRLVSSFDRRIWQKKNSGLFQVFFFLCYSKIVIDNTCVECMRLYRMMNTFQSNRTCLKHPPLGKAFFLSLTLSFALRWEMEICWISQKNRLTKYFLCISTTINNIVDTGEFRKEWKFKKCFPTK